MTAVTPESIGTLSANVWCDAFESAFQTQTLSRIGELEYNDQVAVEMRRYMAELFQFQAHLGKYSVTSDQPAPSTTLHPNYQALAAEAVAAQVERWRASQASFNLSKAMSPYDLDRANPRQLDLDRCLLLNHNPSQYLGRPVKWPAPVRLNPKKFMGLVGLPELGPYVEVLRLTTDGRMQFRAASGLWFRLVGADFRFDSDPPLEISNEVRLSQINNPQFLQFLELLT